MEPEGTMIQALGRYVVVNDPAVCHGQLTFRGTRVLVADVLEQVASGMSWEAIADEWPGAITADAIAEAIRLARAALLTHQEESAPHTAG